MNQYYVALRYLKVSDPMRRIVPVVFWAIAESRSTPLVALACQSLRKKLIGHALTGCSSRLGNAPHLGLDSTAAPFLRQP